MVSPLIGGHFVKQSRQDRPVNPPDIPIGLFIIRKTKISLFCCILENFILGVDHINDERPLTEILFICISACANKFPTFVILYPILPSLIMLFWVTFISTIILFSLTDFYFTFDRRCSTYFLHRTLARFPFAFLIILFFVSLFLRLSLLIDCWI